jgi:hypothetical protein
MGVITEGKRSKEGVCNEKQNLSHVEQPLLGCTLTAVAKSLSERCVLH